MSKSELNDILRFGTQELFKDDNAKDGGENCSSCLQEFFLAWYHYDYQLSSARQSFGDEVLDLKLQCCHGDTFLVSNGNNSVACNFARFVLNDIQR